VNCLSNVDNLGKTVDKLEESVDKLQIMVDNDPKTVDNTQIINLFPYTNFIFW
jgi:hypothetical protein